MTEVEELKRTVMRFHPFTAGSTVAVVLVVGNGPVLTTTAVGAFAVDLTHAVRVYESFVAA